MSHIHADPGQYDFTVSAFIVRTEFDEPKIMLHLHRKNGTYMQFGGHIELHENPWQALGRELREESGYELSQLTILRPHDNFPGFAGGDAIAHPAPLAILSHLVIPGHYHTDITYACVASEPPRHMISPGESAEIKLFTRAELVALPKPQIYDNVRELALFTLDICLPGWERTAPPAKSAAFL
jgi:8-oxo-dGTP pyrophosphatase MutT (NUDIX family)